MRDSSNRRPEGFWPGIVARKWLNISNVDTDFNADTEDDDECGSGTDSDEDFIPYGQGRESQSEYNMGDDDAHHDYKDGLRRRRRRNSVTFRTQYINTKELKVWVGTWNAGGKLPQEDLDIGDWIDTRNPCDIYVFGFQEVVPLNAVNIFGAEDNRAAPKWENIIRETLNGVQPAKIKFKCHSDPSSPSRFKPTDDDASDLVAEELLGTDSDEGEEVHLFNSEFNDSNEANVEIETFENGFIDSEVPKSSDSPALDTFNCLVTQPKFTSAKKLTRSPRIGLSKTEAPLYVLGQHPLARPNTLTSVRSFMPSKSFGRYNSLKTYPKDGSREISVMSVLAELDLESFMKRKKKSAYVRIVSKQMVGIFLTIWVRRCLRHHIQNLRVSTAGVGVMGYIGNKGSVSVSMSVYQTFFCFVCSHLTSGEKDGDEIKRNADVREIHKKTHFRPISNIELPRSIYDHEKIIWLGDLNYRIRLSHDKALELVYKKEWSKMLEMDQLVGEMRKGHAFSGWSEGVLNFPPTYKYENNSDKYCGENPKVASRRTPAWCDRVLCYGKGLRLVSYKRSELRLSDHRPVTATFMAEVEEFSSRKFQRALTLTDAEIENEGFHEQFP